MEKKIAKRITGDESVYDVVTDKSTIESDVEYFIKKYERRIERLQFFLKNLDKIDDKTNQGIELQQTLWNDTCAKTTFKKHHKNLWTSKRKSK